MKKFYDVFNFEEQPILQSGKRCGLEWAPWMGDWFTSWSPRNSNNNAEGPWDHWVDLALQILQDPLTKLVRPEAYAAVVNTSEPANFEPKGFYDEANRYLTEDELAARFADLLSEAASSE